MMQHWLDPCRTIRSTLRPGLLFLLVSLVVGLYAPPLHAQKSDEAQLRQFQRANQYLRRGKTEQAIKLLKELHNEAPENTAFYRKLKEAYEDVKRYDDALRLVEERMKSSPTVSLWSEKARLLYLKEEIERANDTWDRAIQQAPNRVETYRTVYQTLVGLRHFRKAISVLEQGRTTLDRPNAFRTELARLFGLDGQFEKAMKEYTALLADAPQRVGYVRNRLQTFVEQGQGIEASIRVLRQAVEDSPLNPAYRQLLAWLHMEQNDYAAAYDVYRALDRLQEQEGTVLFEFAQKAADAERYDVATQACEAILKRHPNASVAPTVQKTLGDLYREWASADAKGLASTQDTSRYDQARAAYETFLESYPGHPDYPEGLLKLGTLHLDAYHALDKAQSTLKRLVSNYPQTSVAEKGQYHLARIALLRDSLDRARVLFSRLADNAQESDLADRARYELGRLHFYRGEFDAAMARAKATSQNPAADVANDAIELKTLLQENRGPDSLDTALKTFAQARLYARQRTHSKALATLDTLLASHSRHPLVDNARFQRGTIHLARRDTAAAVEAFRAVPERHPRSPYADRSLFRVGQLLEARGKSAAAVEIYNRLLTEYPTSLLAGDARGRLRTLQQAQG
ncbi:MAG: tetratricopeptide repeat protein [Salinibacter sp.]